MRGHGTQIMMIMITMITMIMMIMMIMMIIMIIMIINNDYDYNDDYDDYDDHCHYNCHSHIPSMSWFGMIVVMCTLTFIMIIIPLILLVMLTSENDAQESYQQYLPDWAPAEDGGNRVRVPVSLPWKILGKWVMAVIPI